MLGLSDAQILAQADQLFCGCERGRIQRKLVERRVESWKTFTTNTEVANKKAATHQRELFRSEVPKRLQGLSINSLAAAAASNGKIDTDKIAAIAAAREMRETGTAPGIGGARKRSLLLWGVSSGVGKTGCLTPIFEARAKAGVDCLFISFADMVEQVRAGFKDEQWFARLERARTVPLLFLDDFGYPDRAASDHVREVAMSIMRHRSGADLATLMTSNLTLDDLSEQLGEWLYRRVAEMAAVIHMGGKVLAKLG